MMRGGIKYILLSFLIVAFAFATIFTVHKVECIVTAIVLFGILTLVLWIDIVRASKGNKK